MTLRNLFFKLQIEDFKRRTWSIALSMLFFFLLGPVLLALLLEGMQNSMTAERVIREIKSILGPGFFTHYALTITAALVCAYSGFFFLHSRKKVDFYHSVPAKRELLFGVNYVNGILIYFIPYLINLLLSFLVLLARGYLNSETFLAGLQGISVDLVYFLLIYTLAIIAVMLTGNGVVSILGTGVFLAYGPFLSGVRIMYFTDFFQTYVGSISDDSKILQFLSPLGKYFYRSEEIQKGNYSGILSSVLITLAVTVLLTAFALFLYKKRPSEAAGKAMAFELAKPIIKFLMIVPVTLAGGLVFREAANVHSDGWLIFGLILIFVIFGAIVEIIYQFDLKKAFAHKAGLAVSGAVVLLFVCIFRFDLLSYDSYIPDKDKVATMSISIPGIDGDKRNTQINDAETGYDYYNSFQYEIKNMRIKNFDDAYEMAKLGVRNLKEDNKEIGQYYFCQIAYQFKNGKTVLRSYYVDKEEGTKLLSKIYTNSDFKEGAYPIYQWKSSYITGIHAYNYRSDKDFTLTAGEISEFLEIYKKELKALTIEEIQNSLPVGRINFELIYNRGFDYYIFPSFTKTIEFLEAHGFQASGGIKADEVKKIIIKNYARNYTYADGMEYAVSYDKMQDNGYVYEGKAEIEEILKKALPSDYCNSYNALIMPNYELEVNVVLGTDNYGNEMTLNYYFPGNDIPGFVMEDTDYTP